MTTLIEQINQEVQRSASPIKRIIVPIGSEAASLSEMWGIPVSPHPSVAEDTYFLQR